jgi:hypothetical protein
MAIALFLLTEQNIADERLEELIGGVDKKPTIAQAMITTIVP